MGLQNWIKGNSVHFRFLLNLLLVLLVIPQVAFSKDNCPALDAPAASAVRLELFTAWQTGFDGYQTPCSIQCMDKEKCTMRCQSQKGFEYLTKQIGKLENKFETKNCPSFHLICFEQCKDQGPACSEACGLSPVAKK